MTLFLSALVGFIANLKKPKILINLIIKSFVSFYKIDLTLSNKNSFSSLNEMFTRTLKKNFSSIDEKSFIHPAQAKLVSFGKVKEGETYLIKGKNYSSVELLGDDVKDIDLYYFYNYYLSPQDYHRVHHPVSGELCFTKEIKGPLYPVAPWFIKLVPSVFAKNYRTVSLVKSITYGDVYTVMVGALNVGSIKMSKGLFYTTLENKSDNVSNSSPRNKNISVRSGDELGVFKMGSSVVVFTQKKLPVKEGKVFFDTLQLY